MYKKPNFFIIGAPKCGTTALSEYIRTHPNIFLSNPKEPHFFAQDITGYSCCSDLNSYKNIFSNVTSDEISVGEASVLYLYSSEAVQKIYEFNKDAKIIIMLRNHLEYIYSYHNQLLLNTDENEVSFQTAWNLEKSRKSNKNIPKNCRCKKLLYYRDVGRVGLQVEKVLEIFPKEQIMFILMDDIKSDMRKVYLDTLNFLEVEDDGRIDFPKINENKRYKSTFIGNLSNNPPVFLMKISKFIKKILGLQKVHFMKKIHEKNKETVQREPLSIEFKKELMEEFKEDIERLEKLINRDLSSWKKI